MRQILLERDTELAALDQALLQARSGAGALVLVEGPAGIGKTRLLGEAVDRAKELGMRHFRGRGAELERGMAFGVARQLLGPTLLSLAEGERTAFLDGPAAGAGAILARMPAAAADQAALIDALYWAIYEMTRLTIEGASPTGALIVLDDAQWADPASLRLLVRMTVGLDEIGAALLVGVRSGEPTPGGLLERLRAHPGARVLHPATLTENAVAMVVRDQLGDGVAAALCQACATATGGNPFLLTELVASLRADGAAPGEQLAVQVQGMVPEAVLHSVLLRLTRLDAAARALAQAASLLGADAPLRHAAALADLEADDSLLAADALVTAGILGHGDPVRFAHPLIADAIAADLSEIARVRGHRRAAELLAADGARAERIAAHLRLTPPRADPWVVEMLQAAALDATARGEALEAAQLLERALNEPPPADAHGDVLRDLVRAEAAAGLPRALERIALAPDMGDDPRERARTLQAMSRLLFSRGEVADAVQAAEQGRAALAPGDQLSGRILASQVATMFFMPGVWGKTEQLIRELQDGLESGTWQPEPLLLAQLSTYWGVWLTEGPERLRPLAEAVLATVPDVREVWQGDPSLAATLVFVGEDRLADAVLARMAGHAQRTGSPIYANMTAQWRAALRLQQGWVADAALDAERVLDAASLGWTSETGWGATWLALARLELGDPDGARAAIAAGMRANHAALPHGFVLYGAGHVALAGADPEAALAHFTAAGRHLRDRYGLENPAVVPWQAGAALALAGLGEAQRSAQAAATHLATARRTRVPHAIGLALRVAAETAGEDSVRVSVLEEAVAVLAPSGAQLEHARVITELGAAMRRRRETAVARATLARGLELAQRLGATVTAQRAQRELRLSGARPGRRAQGDLATALTPAERRVAELAAQDLSNAQIARVLFVTPRTVEWHLTQTYRKLGIRSRVGIAQALVDAQIEL